MAKVKRNGVIGEAWVKGTTALSTRAMLLIGATMVLLRPTLAYANPQGGQIVGGSATITTSGNTLDIDQTSSKAIINWSSFDIAPGEKVDFIQPSSSSIALNRVSSNNPTQILGQLDANGQVVLVNPNGVFFGKDSQVNAAGIIATTANISDSNFMAGNYNYSQPGNPNGSVSNQGTIKVKDAGLAGFVAPNVENDGTITAKLGTVALDSGDTFTLDMAGDNLITVAASGNLKQQLASNAGTIKANGGTVTLTAAAARGLVNSLVSNSGIIQANSIGRKDGHIYLYAAGSNAVPGNVAANKGQSTGTSEVLNSGTLSASGTGAGETGGSITVTADNVGILSGSVIDASGDAGGGTIQIGGDFHGQGSTPTAVHTIVQSGTVIDASAITSGNGGKVTVWADDWTNFAGPSWHAAVRLRQRRICRDLGQADADHERHGGRLGPERERRHLAHGPGGRHDLNRFDSGISGNPNFTPDGSQAEAVINVSDITTALNAGTNVTVTTGGDSASGTNNGQITVATPITLNATSNNNATLTLSAYSNIVFNTNDGITAPTTGTGKLNVILDADNGANAGGRPAAATSTSATSPISPPTAATSSWAAATAPSAPAAGMQ